MSQTMYKVSQVWELQSCLDSLILLLCLYGRISKMIRKVFFFFFFLQVDFHGSYSEAHSVGDFGNISVC